MAKKVGNKRRIGFYKLQEMMTRFVNIPPSRVRKVVEVLGFQGQIVYRLLKQMRKQGKQVNIGNLLPMLEEECKCLSGALRTGLLRKLKEVQAHPVFSSALITSSQLQAVPGMSDLESGDEDEKKTKPVSCFVDLRSSGLSGFVDICDADQNTGSIPVMITKVQNSYIIRFICGAKPTLSRGSDSIYIKYDLPDGALPGEDEAVLASQDFELHQTYTRTVMVYNADLGKMKCKQVSQSMYRINIPFHMSAPERVVVPIAGLDEEEEEEEEQ